MIIKLDPTHEGLVLQTSEEFAGLALAQAVNFLSKSLYNPGTSAEDIQRTLMRELPRYFSTEAADGKVAFEVGVSGSGEALIPGSKVYIEEEQLAVFTRAMRDSFLQYRSEGNSLMSQCRTTHGVLSQYASRLLTVDWHPSINNAVAEAWREKFGELSEAENCADIAISQPPAFEAIIPVGLMRRVAALVSTFSEESARRIIASGKSIDMVNREDCEDAYRHFVSSCVNDAVWVVRRALPRLEASRAAFLKANTKYEALSKMLARVFSRIAVNTVTAIFDALDSEEADILKEAVLSLTELREESPSKDNDLSIIEALALQRADYLPKVDPVDGLRKRLFADDVSGDALVNSMINKIMSGEAFADVPQWKEVATLLKDKFADPDPETEKSVIFLIGVHCTEQLYHLHMLVADLIELSYETRNGKVKSEVVSPLVQAGTKVGNAASQLLNHWRGVAVKL